MSKVLESGRLALGGERNWKLSQQIQGDLDANPGRQGKSRETLIANPGRGNPLRISKVRANLKQQVAGIQELGKQSHRTTTGVSSTNLVP